MALLEDCYPCADIDGYQGAQHVDRLLAVAGLITVWKRTPCAVRLSILGCTAACLTQGLQGLLDAQVQDGQVSNACA